MEAINDFIKEGQRAEDWWQENRGSDQGEFWPKFKEFFPLVYEMLDDIQLAGKDCNNALAGTIDFGSESEQAGCDAGTLYFDALVWHFADWNILAHFLEKKFGLTNARWLSDEYVDEYDLL